MPYVKGFCDIYRRIVDTYRFARALAGCAVKIAFLFNLRKRGLCKPRLVDFEIEIAVYRRNFGYYAVGSNTRRQLVGNNNGRFAHNFGKFKAGQSVVAHIRIGRNGDSLLYFLGGNALRLYSVCDIFPVIHNTPVLFAYILPYAQNFGNF